MHTQKNNIATLHIFFSFFFFCSRGEQWRYSPDQAFISDGQGQVSNVMDVQLPTTRSLLHSSSSVNDTLVQSQQRHERAATAAAAGTTGAMSGSFSPAEKSETPTSIAEALHNYLVRAFLLLFVCLFVCVFCMHVCL